jgi:hypothetical protein
VPLVLNTEEYQAQGNEPQREKRRKPWPKK